MWQAADDDARNAVIICSKIESRACGTDATTCCSNFIQYALKCILDAKLHAHLTACTPTLAAKCVLQV